jgi:hypothetical protein
MYELHMGASKAYVKGGANGVKEIYDTTKTAHEQEAAWQVQ